MKRFQHRSVIALDHVTPCGGRFLIDSLNLRKRRDRSKWLRAFSVCYSAANPRESAPTTPENWRATPTSGGPLHKWNGWRREAAREPVSAAGTHRHSVSPIPPYLAPQAPNRIGPRGGAGLGLTENQIPVFPFSLAQPVRVNRRCWAEIRASPYLSYPRAL